MNYFKLLFCLVTFMSSMCSYAQQKKSNLYNARATHLERIQEIKKNSTNQISNTENDSHSENFIKKNKRCESHFKLLVNGTQIDTAICQEWDEDDSTWVNSEMYISTHDSDGNINLETAYYWEDSTWTMKYKTEYTFDSNGHLTEELSSEWDSTEWVQDWKDFYAYDSNGNLIVTGYYYWWDDTLSAWENGYKDSTVYDSSGQITYQYSIYWDSSSWEYDYKAEFEYDSSGNLSEITYYYWDSGQWELDNLIVNEYDSTGNLIYSVGKTWYSASWEAYDSTSYLYDNNDYVTQKITYYYDWVNWDPNYKVNYEYSTDYLTTIEYDSAWTDTTWEFQYTFTESYDVNGNLLFESYLYNYYGYTFGGQYYYSYNSDNSVTDYLALDWNTDSSTWDSTYKTHTEFLSDGGVWYFELEYNGNSWDSIMKCHANYNPFVGMQEANLSNNEVLIYPNPLSETATIYIEDYSGGTYTLHLYDMFGKLVKNELINNTYFTFSRSNLVNGVYLFNISDGESKNVSSGKLILE